MNKSNDNRDSFAKLFRSCQSDSDPETTSVPFVPRLEVGATYVWRPKKYPSPNQPGGSDTAMLTVWVGGDVHSDGSASPAGLVTLRRNDVVTVIDIIEAPASTGSHTRNVNYIGLFQGQTITFSINGTWLNNVVQRRAIYDSFVHINKVRAK